jgi:predicted GIY-YIG superfamily endonuclease
MMGIVYLLHFSEPYRHAKHYTGWTLDLDARLAQHRAGTGARLIQVITEAGIGFEVARTWKGDRWLERRLKRSYHGPPVCPLCNPERANNRANWEKSMNVKGKGHKVPSPSSIPDREGQEASDTGTSPTRIPNSGDIIPTSVSSIIESALDLPDDLFSEARWMTLTQERPVIYFRDVT